MMEKGFILIDTVWQLPDLDDALRFHDDIV
jgi:hypothetical protein